MAIREATPIVLTAEERIRLKGWVHLDGCTAASLLPATEPRGAGGREDATRRGAVHRATHLETIARWETELAEERERFIALTGEQPPAAHKVGPWVEARLPPKELAWMPRTKSGALSARGDLLKHLAHHEEIRPLLRVLWAARRLQKFGYVLLEAVDPITGRIYPDYLTCGAKTGRLTSSRPNGQQLPQDGRSAVTAPPERRLVCGDLDQVELRVLAELAGDDAMRAVFAAGGDVHKRTASLVAGVPEARSTRTIRVARPRRPSTSASRSPRARARCAPPRGRSSMST